MGRVAGEHPGATAIEYTLPWGVVVRGQRWGAAPDRVLLIHEPGQDLDTWNALPVRLARELMVGVAAFDLPGHGLSDDPWEPSRLVDALRALIARAELPFRQFLVTAGLTAGAALDVAPDLPRIALVCLSPESPPAAMPPPRSPETPKLFFASSLAGADVEHARTLARYSGGWSNVASIPVEETKTALLASHWSDQIEEGIVSFARDFLALRAPFGRQHPDDLNAACDADQLREPR